MLDKVRVLLLIILIGLATYSSGQSQRIYNPPLVGRWIATVPAKEDVWITRDNQPIRFQGRRAYTVTLDFKSDNLASM